ncbi:MAG: putative toxin-antitoxin system toxin component, PIN family [Verrucomicrobiota bacterium]
MLIAVFDTNVIYSALYFGGKPLLCLQTVALGFSRPAITNEIWKEYEDILPHAPQRYPLKPKVSEWLAWFKLAAIKVEPAELGEISSRDLKDNPFIACAIASHAEFLISGDDDLLSMKHRLNFRIVKPADFLSQISS